MTSQKILFSAEENVLCFFLYTTTQFDKIQTISRKITNILATKKAEREVLSASGSKAVCVTENGFGGEGIFALIVAQGGGVEHGHGVAVAVGVTDVSFRLPLIFSIFF